MSDADQTGGMFELLIEPGTGRYDPDDERWRRQVSDLYRDLDRDVGDLRRERAPVPGTKGAVESIVLALGSAGAFTVALDFFRAWLARDRSRSLDISWTVDGVQEQITVRGDAIDASTLQAIAAAAARRFGGSGEWPAASTAPS